MTSPQPGWYPNPDGSPDLRYWDGTAWTQQRRPAPTQTPQSESSVAQTPPPEPTVVFPQRDDLVVDPQPGSSGEPAPSSAESIPGPAAVAPDAAQPETGEPGTLDVPSDQEQPAVAGETIQFPPEPTPTRDTTVFPDQGQPGPPVAAAPLTPPPPAPAPPTPPPPPVVPPPVAPPAGGFAAPPAQGYGQQYPPSAGLTPPVPYYPPAATTPVTSGSGIGVAALVVGILAVILSFSCFFFPFIPIIVGIAAGVLGIIGINQANAMTPPASKGMPVTGLILGGVALVISVLFVVLLVVGSSSGSGF